MKEEKTWRGGGLYDFGELAASAQEEEEKRSTVLSLSGGHNEKGALIPFLRRRQQNEAPLEDLEFGNSEHCFLKPILEALLGKKVFRDEQERRGVLCGLRPRERNK